MSEEEILSTLKERVKIDRSLRNEIRSDFDQFCENECIAIERINRFI